MRAHKRLGEFAIAGPHGAQNLPVLGERVLAPPGPIGRTGAVEPQTQIHTHMCYSEFNDIIDAIMAMDADVITIETSRSQMELLDAFNARHYASEIGPGVYDIHSPRVPDVQEMVNLMHQAAQRIPREQLWVNPDCGLKTRGWPETRAALVNMVAAAEQLRAEAQAEA